MKILLAGLGRWGSNHLRILKMLGARVFVADPSPRAKKTALENGVPEKNFSASFEDFIDEADAVDVVTSADTHYMICMEALRKGKDVFVEKPLTLKSAECRELSEIADRKKSILQVGHVFRFDPATSFMARQIKEGVLGKVQWMIGNFYGFKRPRMDAGVTWSDSLHFIDLFNYLTGSVPRKVLARLKDNLGRGMDDASWVSLVYEDAEAEVRANYFRPRKRREIVIIGSEATLECDFSSSQDKIKIYKNTHIKNENTWVATQGEVITQEIMQAEPLALELESFIDCVKTREKPLAGGWDGYNVVKVIEAAYESSKSGKIVDLT
ncbi:MAG: Gfo/Idh/MocA family oxidoreductase [bacterium]|nr:Gfo/Idh/MocA family oxidoreductase [bacterium]